MLSSIVRRIADDHHCFLGDDPFNDCLRVEAYLPGPEVAVGRFFANSSFWSTRVFDKAKPVEGRPRFCRQFLDQPRSIPQEIAYTETDDHLNRPR